MSEVPSPREHHCDILLIRRLDDRFVANGPTGLHDRPGSSSRDRVEAVAERKERVRRGNRSGQIGHGLHRRDLDGVDPTHLTRSDGG